MVDFAYCYGSLFREITVYLEDKYSNEYNDEDFRKWKNYRYKISTINVIYANLNDEVRDSYRNQIRYYKK